MKTKTRTPRGHTALGALPPVDIEKCRRLLHHPFPDKVPVLQIDSMGNADMPYRYNLQKSADTTEKFGNALATDAIEALEQIGAYRRANNLPDMLFEICADQADPAATFFLEKIEHPRSPGTEPERIWLRAAIAAD
jgi:hypothetical protein